MILMIAHIAISGSLELSHHNPIDQNDESRNEDNERQNNQDIVRGKFHQQCSSYYLIFYITKT